MLKNVFGIASSFIILVFSCIDKRKKINCSKCKTGNFIYKSRNPDLTAFIERTDSVQVENNLQTGFVTKAKIKWLSDCEFQLSYISSEEPGLVTLPQFFKNKTLETKILLVADDYYIVETEMEEIDFKIKDTMWFKK